MIRTSALTAASQTQGVRLYECLILTKLISSKQTLYCKFVETVFYVINVLVGIWPLVSLLLKKQDNSYFIETKVSSSKVLTF